MNVCGVSAKASVVGGQVGLAAAHLQVKQSLVRACMCKHQFYHSGYWQSL